MGHWTVLVEMDWDRGPHTIDVVSAAIDVHASDELGAVRATVESLPAEDRAKVIGASATEYVR